ncbi:MAG: hypothetical protein P8L44_16950, partial [Opitutales bacterium]|nr:hypothetical protein [Opitutales bacterium]
MSTLLKKTILPLLSSMVLFVGLTSSLSASPELEHFEKKIRPLLAAKCLDCHSAKKQDGGLRLDSEPHWEMGGISGP